MFKVESLPGEHPIRSVSIEPYNWVAKIIARLVRFGQWKYVIKLAPPLKRT